MIVRGEGGRILSMETPAFKKITNSEPGNEWAGEADPREMWAMHRAERGNQG